MVFFKLSELWGTVHFGFDTKDQFLYEHLDLRYDLRAAKIQDTKNKVDIEKMREMFQKIKEIKIPQEVIPTDLYKEYLIKCNEESKALKKI